jgi:4-oxalocrotonate tautomerase
MGNAASEPGDRRSWGIVEGACGFRSAWNYGQKMFCAGSKLPAPGKAGKENPMPFVNIKITKDGVTAEQKERVIEGVTQVLADVLGKNPQTTFVLIEEIETDNWGIGGESITVRRKRG